MTDTSNRRRRFPLVIGGAVAASVLVLGLSGTLSSWTQAIITNSTNTVSAVTAVALSEASGETVCTDTATSTTNTATCATINKYGGQTLEPGGTTSTTVTLKNTGTGAGTLSVAAEACSITGGTTPSEGSLCGIAQVGIVCPTVAVITPMSLTAFDSATSTTVPLAAGASVNCTVTVTLPSDAPSSVAGQTASQSILWTLASA